MPEIRPSWASKAKATAAGTERHAVNRVIGLESWVSPREVPGAHALRAADAAGFLNGKKSIFGCRRSPKCGRLRVAYRGANHATIGHWAVSEPPSLSAGSSTSVGVAERALNGAGKVGFAKRLANHHAPRSQ